MGSPFGVPHAPYGIILNLILVLWKSEPESVNFSPSEKHSLRHLPGLGWLKKGGGAVEMFQRSKLALGTCWGTGSDSLGLQERG